MKTFSSTLREVSSRLRRNPKLSAVILFVAVFVLVGVISAVVRTAEAVEPPKPEAHLFLAGDEDVVVVCWVHEGLNCVPVAPLSPPRKCFWKADQTPDCTEGHQL